jgi:exodeoxyribonuclease VII large subunit
LKLSELTELINESIINSFPDYYNVVAEISQISRNASGHVYLQLVEKEQYTDKITANLRAAIWSSRFNMIQPYFKAITGMDLSTGIKILAKVEVSFHQVYGLSLIIQEIDPTYTLGEIEKRRQEIINQLVADGIFDENKKLELPLVIQHIAIITSETAAGYEDFVNQLNNNKNNYKFEFQLFSATMQGEKTEKSVIFALDKILLQKDDFDIVVIIRGGGSKLDLSAFDSYEIASNVAQFPIPVLTGIGHQRDMSITDMVAYKSLKTPTAVADFLIQNFADFENILIDKYNKINFSANKIIQNQTNKLSTHKKILYENTFKIFFDKTLKFNNLYQKLLALPKQILNEKNIDLKNKELILKNSLKHFLMIENQKLLLLSSSLENNNPQNILKKGFSMTTKNGKIVKSTQELAKNDKLTTYFEDGKIVSTVD